MTALVAALCLVGLAAGWRLRPAPRRVRTLVDTRPDLGPRAAGERGAAAQAPASSRATSHRRVGLLGGAVAWVGLAVMSPVLGVAVVVVLAVRPRWRAARAEQRRQAAIDRALPDLLDLFVVALGAGLTPQHALARLARAAPPPLRAALAEVGRRTERGVRFTDALDALPEALGDPARPLAVALRTGERDGVPLGPLLDVLAREARDRRRRTAEATARRLPVRLAFPLTCCILPAFVLLTVAPLLAGAIAGLRR